MHSVGTIMSLIPVIVILSSFYVDVSTIYLVYYSERDDVIRDISGYNLYILVALTILAIISVFIIWLRKIGGAEVSLHRHYIQHFMFFRIFYLFTIKRWFGTRIKTNLFTDGLLLVTALANFLLSAGRVGTIIAHWDDEHGWIYNEPSGTSYYVKPYIAIQDIYILGFSTLLSIISLIISVYTIINNRRLGYNFKTEENNV